MTVWSGARAEVSLIFKLFSFGKQIEIYFVGRRFGRPSKVWFYWVEPKGWAGQICIQPRHKSKWYVIVWFISLEKSWIAVLSGSSSGSAVAVSAGFVPAALGEETCGSIISPASRAVSLQALTSDLYHHSIVCYNNRVCMPWNPGKAGLCMIHIKHRKLM